MLFFRFFRVSIFSYRWSLIAGRLPGQRNNDIASLEAVADGLHEEGWLSGTVICGDLFG